MRRSRAARRRRGGPRAASSRSSRGRSRRSRASAARARAETARGDADQHLERPLPALPLDRAARAEERRRPDPHQARAERDVEERPPRSSPDPDSTMKNAIDAKITGWITAIRTKKQRLRQALQVEEPADREQRARRARIRRSPASPAARLATSNARISAVADGDVDDADQRLGRDQAADVAERRAVGQLAAPPRSRA